jgi:hypothetical protein
MPVIQCPASITKSTLGNSCSRTIAILDPYVDDNCFIGKLTWTMSGATTGSSPKVGVNYVKTQTFNAGLTTVTYTATDYDGNTVSCSFTVNVLTSGNCNQGQEEKGLITLGKMSVNTFPNPSEHYFNLRISTQSRENVMVRIMDISGRVLQEMKGSPDNVYRFGDRLMTGAYMVEVRQGNSRTVSKVIKQ